MPSMPFEVTRRVSRNAEQKWLLDSVIGLLGPDSDQGRLVYLSAVCGHDSQADFMGMKFKVKIYNDPATPSLAGPVIWYGGSGLRPPKYLLVVFGEMSFLRRDSPRTQTTNRGFIGN
jgi:hypothetical protein